MLRRRSLSPLLAAAAALTSNVTYAQPPKPPQPMQPLGDVLHQVFDQDKDGKVTMPEVKVLLKSLEAMMGNGEGAEGAKMRRLLSSVASAAPTLFDLFDVNQDKTLSKAELRYATQLEKSMDKGGGMRVLVRDVFEILDADGDDQLSLEELAEGSRSDEAAGKLATKFHALLPLRQTPEELEPFVSGVLAADAKAWFAWFDVDGDGLVQRKEVGKRYNAAGREFLDIVKTIKQVGPMLAMLGGGAFGDMGGGGFQARAAPDL